MENELPKICPEWIEQRIEEERRRIIKKLRPGMRFNLPKDYYCPKCKVDGGEFTVIQLEEPHLLGFACSTCGEQSIHVIDRTPMEFMTFTIGQAGDDS